MGIGTPPPPAGPRRAVFPLASLNLSGGVKNLLVQAGALADAGLEVWLLVPDWSRGRAPEVPANVRTRVLGCGPRWLPHPVRALLYYLRLAATCTTGADLCVVAYYPTVYCAVISNLLRRARARVLYSVAAYEPFTHGSAAEAGPTRGLRAALARASYRLPVQRVYASRWLSWVVADPGGCVIGRGINPAVFTAEERASTSRGPVRVGVIGRSGAVKGHADVVAALEALAGWADVLVRLVGVDDVARPTGLAIEALPPQDEAGMAAFYRGCDVFVFGSLSEGFPAPPLEAMACGCAVVATDSGGIGEYAEDGENCLLVPPGDAAALAQALRRVVDDATLRTRLANAGVRTAAHFPTSAMVERFLAVALPRAR